MVRSTRSWRLRRSLVLKARVGWVGRTTATFALLLIRLTKRRRRKPILLLLGHLSRGRRSSISDSLLGSITSQLSGLLLQCHVVEQRWQWIFPPTQPWLSEQDFVSSSKIECSVSPSAFRGHVQQVPTEGSLCQQVYQPEASSSSSSCQIGKYSGGQAQSQARQGQYGECSSGRGFIICHHG